MGQPQLLFAGTYDDLDNAWMMPATVLEGSGTGVSATTGCFFSGPEGCVIEDVYYIARDLTFTAPAGAEPTGNVHIGLRIRPLEAGAADPMPIWATADCPQIWDNVASDNGDFTLDMPVKAFTFVGAGTGGLDAPSTMDPIVVAANVHVKVEIAPVLAGALVDMPAADLDSLDVLVYGHYKG